MKYFDAHDHLQNFASEDELGAALRAAGEAGVEDMLCCGTCPEDWGRVLELAGRDARIKPCFGLHPWQTAEEGWLPKLEEFVRRTPCCVGEIGLDGVKGLPGQEEIFVAQLALAARFDRPVVLHCVKSWGRMLDLLKPAHLGAFMLHAYSGSAELVKDLSALGGYFSFGPEITDPARERLRAALAAVPPDRLLFETEAPEHGHSPAAVKEVVAAAAELLNRPVEELAALTYANGLRFIGELK